MFFRTKMHVLKFCKNGKLYFTLMMYVTEERACGHAKANHKIFIAIRRGAG